MGEFAMKAPFIIAALFLVMVAVPAEAQFTSSFGNSGFGTTGIGSASSSPFVQFGSGTLFSGNGAGMGSGTMNPGGFGQNGPGFFGNPNVNSQNQFNNRNMLQNSMFNRTGMRNQMYNPMGSYGGMGGNTAGPRVSIKLGAGEAGLKNLPPSSPPHFSEFLTKRMNNILSSKTLGSVRVMMQGDKAILQGSVATDHARDLASRLMLLEPGIEAVQNDLTVGSTAP
jgi:hypothetical protein